jgi:aminopeptidase N
VRLRFGGRIDHGLAGEPDDYARSFSRTAGIISEEGVFLSGKSYWLPRFGTELFSFDVTVTLPGGWDVVTQGHRTLHEVGPKSGRVRWSCPHPMEEVYLVANRFVEYSRSAGEIEVYAFLRTPEPNLARRYLDAAARYIEMYSKLIGPYPYRKFALVENFWESGYGMPSFTLLGPRVIRLPFILHSSFPHEILHSWWGNSVFVDYETGNWCEGLTAYLADHLVKEGQGRGSEYRRDALGTYRSYVREARDFPLREFRSRHSAASQAIGYGKSLMMWHMLRVRLGDEKFVEALQRVYRRFRFRRASYADLKEVFSEVAGESLDPFFLQWVDRTGAPLLAFDVEALDGHRIRVTVRQEQEAELYELTTHLALTLAGEPKARLVSLEIRDRTSTFDFDLPAATLRLDLDPYFDLFRRLDRREIPGASLARVCAGAVPVAYGPGCRGSR